MITKEEIQILRAHLNRTKDETILFNLDRWSLGGDLPLTLDYLMAWVSMEEDPEMHFMTFDFDFSTNRLVPNKTISIPKETTCKSCANLVCVNSGKKTSYYCGAQHGERTFNNLLKIKQKDTACHLYSKQGEENDKD